MLFNLLWSPSVMNDGEGSREQGEVKVRVGIFERERGRYARIRWDLAKKLRDSYSFKGVQGVVFTLKALRSLI